MTTAISSDRIGIELAGREFGTTTSPETKFSGEPLEVFRELIPQLKGQSRLLAMKLGEASRDQIFDARAYDLALLEGAYREFGDCVRSAIKQSIIGASESTEAATKKVDSTWVALCTQVPAMGRAPLVALPHTRAALPETELLTELQQEFVRSIGQLLQLFSFWLQALVEKEFIGLVEWTSVDVCRYHYFRREQADKVKGKWHTTEHDFDSARPEGTRNIYTTTEHRTIQRSQFLERHVHHIVRALPHAPSRYSKAMPVRVARFLESVPSWLMPHLNIVEGTITMEEVLRRKTGDETISETEVISVEKYSPTVALGPYSLLGWSADDLKGETAHWRGQAVVATIRKKERNQTFRIAATLVTLAALAIFGIVSSVRSSNAKSVARYEAYIAPFAQSEVRSAGVGDTIIFLPSQARVRYAGRAVWGSTNQIVVTVDGEMTQGFNSTSSWPTKHYFSAPERIGGKLYGSLNLAPELGIYAKLHVLVATQDSIRYVVEPYGSNRAP